MKRYWLLYLVIFSLALNLGTISTLVYLRYREPTAGAAKELPPMPMRELWGALKLEPEQRQALRELFPDHRRRVMEVRLALAQKRQELFDLLQQESPADAALKAKVQEISTLQGQLEEEMTRFLLELKKRLKPEQHQAFLKLVQARLERGGLGPPHGPRGRHWGRGPGMGMGPGMGPPGPPPPSPESK